MSFSYSLQKIDEHTARAMGKDLPISFKQSIEICNYIRNNPIAKAKLRLTNAIEKTKPIPFKRFTNGLGHKKGPVLAGRYPLKACQQILKLISSAESNALFKGLNSKDLVVAHISVKQAPSSWRYGRNSRRQMKKCHIEVVLKETKPKKTEEKPKAEKVAVEKKPEQSVKPTQSAKPVQPTEVKKAEPKTEKPVETPKEAKVEVKTEAPKATEAKPVEVKTVPVQDNKDNNIAKNDVKKEEEQPKVTK